MFVEIALTPSPTPVGQPLGVTGVLDTKDGRSAGVHHAPSPLQPTTDGTALRSRAHSDF
jgi:hypothetical protein